MKRGLLSTLTEKIYSLTSTPLFETLIDWFSAPPTPKAMPYRAYHYAHFIAYRSNRYINIHPDTIKILKKHFVFNVVVYNR